MTPSRLYARLCHSFLVQSMLAQIIFFHIRRDFVNSGGDVEFFVDTSSVCFKQSAPAQRACRVDEKYLSVG